MDFVIFGNDAATGKSISTAFGINQITANIRRLLSAFSHLVALALTPVAALCFLTIFSSWALAHHWTLKDTAYFLYTHWWAVTAIVGFTWVLSRIWMWVLFAYFFAIWLKNRLKEDVEPKLPPKSPAN